MRNGADRRLCDIIQFPVPKAWGNPFGTCLVLGLAPLFVVHVTLICPQGVRGLS